MRKIHVLFLLLILAIIVISVFLIRKYSTNGEDSNSLPLVKITLARNTSPVSRDTWSENCNIRFYDEDGWSVYHSTFNELKGRGHSTSDKPKKPYNIKLENAHKLFGMPSHERWVLLAGFFDHSLIRNALGAEIARQTSLASTTPQGRFVQLDINDENQGVYYLCERTLDMADEENVLLEFDTYSINEDEYVFQTKQNSLPVSVRTPKKLTIPMFEAIQELVNQADSCPSRYVDFDTFADYLLVEELCQNGELNGPRSCFMQLLPDGRFTAGPVWDFDLAFITVGIDEGNDLRPLRKANLPGVRLLTGDSLYNTRALWYSQLLQDSAFVKHVKQRWSVLKPRFESLTTFIDSVDNRIRPMAILDQKQWNQLEPARFDTCTSYSSAVSTLKSTYKNRIVQLDSLLRKL